jgi:hypothetical protein
VRRLRSEGSQKVRAITEAVLLMTLGIPIEELDDAAAYLDSLTTTNCWCVEYALRDGLWQLISDHREFVNRQAALMVAKTAANEKP